MLIKHSAYYFLGRGLPGAINLGALALFTRLLSPNEYGRYALVIAGAGLAGSLMFQWLRLGVLRFLRAEPQRRNIFLSTILVGFLCLTFLSLLAGILLWWLVDDISWRNLIVLGLLLLWAQAFFELNQELSRSQLSPRAYGVAAVFKSIFALTLGWGAARIGWGAEGLIFGLIIGHTFPLLWQIPGNWRGVRLSLADREIVRRLLHYGLPLTVTFALSFIVSSSDRFILAWIMDADAAGLYSVGYNFAQHTLVILMMVVNLAAYPLAVKALEESGEEAARQQVMRNGKILLLVACPASAGLAVLASNISGVFLGEAFRDTASTVVPWIALGVFLSGIKAYHLDLSFQLGNRTVHQVWIVMIAAILNVGLNIWWIPLFGILGAAYSTVASYLVGVITSWVIGKRVFPVPFSPGGAMKILAATTAMVLALFPITGEKGIVALGFQVGWGAFVYIVVLLLLEWCEVRNLRSLWPALKRGYLS